MSMDAMNALRSLFAPTLRSLDASQGDAAEKAFLDVLSSDKKAKAAVPVIDGLPVEQQQKETPEISDVPETPDDAIDPQSLLTQKLAASMMGFQGWTLTDVPETPVPDSPTA